MRSLEENVPVEVVRAFARLAQAELVEEIHPQLSRPTGNGMLDNFAVQGSWSMGAGPGSYELFRAHLTVMWEKGPQRVSWAELSQFVELAAAWEVCAEFLGWEEP